MTISWLGRTCHLTQTPNSTQQASVYPKISNYTFKYTTDFTSVFLLKGNFERRTLNKPNHVNISTLSTSSTNWCFPEGPTQRQRFLGLGVAWTISDKKSKNLKRLLNVWRYIVNCKSAGFLSMFIAGTHIFTHIASYLLLKVRSCWAIERTGCFPFLCFPPGLLSSPLHRSRLVLTSYTKLIKAPWPTSPPERKNSGLHLPLHRWKKKFIKWQSLTGGEESDRGELDSLRGSGGSSVQSWLGLPASCSGKRHERSWEKRE